jgi:TM2 domain-containing membrane protein YozV
MPLSLLCAQFIIVGNRRTTRTFGQLEWPCPKCHRTTLQGAQSVATKVTVFFVPLIALPVFYRFACSACGQTTPMPAHLKPAIEAWARTGQRPSAAALAIPARQTVAALPVTPVAGPQPRKSPMVAVLLSALLPGLGHLYVGDTRKGTRLIAAGIASFFLAVVVIGLFTGLAVWVYAMVDAYKAAARTNPPALAE